MDYVWTGIGVVASAVICFIVYRRWHAAEPNEWLLLIENGQMKSGGIGLKCFVWPS